MFYLEAKCPYLLAIVLNRIGFEEAYTRVRELLEAGS